MKNILNGAGKEWWSKYKDLFWIIIIILGFITNAILNYTIKATAIQQNTKQTQENKIDIKDINRRLNSIENLLSRQDEVNKKINDTYEAVDKIRDYLMKGK